MAGTTSDHSTGWVPFHDYCLDRATKIPGLDPVARVREAERLTLERVRRLELEIRWYDIDGHTHSGLPAGFWPTFRYDFYQDATFELLPNGRALYRPQVRELRGEDDPTPPIDAIPIMARIGPRSPAERAPDRPTQPPIRIYTLPLRQVARVVARLPAYLFIPLNDAFVEARSRLGSGELTARDFTQYARARRLTIAARWILPDGTERVVIFRPIFWQYYAIACFPSVEDYRRDRAGVRGVQGGRLPGRQWFFFVGCKRFKQLFSTVAPSKTAASKSAEQRPSRQMNELPRPEPKTTDKTQEEVFATAVSATAAKQGRNWHPAQDEIAEDAIKLWPPNGIVPENLGATDLHNALFDLHKSEADEKSKLTGKREAPRKTRSLDTCEDFLKNQHSKK